MLSQHNVVKSGRESRRIGFERVLAGGDIGFTRDELQHFSAGDIDNRYIDAARLRYAISHGDTRA